MVRMTPRIHVHPADIGGCGHYRMIWPAQAMIDEGRDVHLMMPENPASDFITTMVRGRDGREHVVGVEHPGCDIVVIQRPLHRLLAQVIPLLQEQGVRVVVELDDDFENIHPQNVAWATAHPKYSPDRNYRHLKEACSLADAMVVSTPALCRYKPEAVEVMDNYVPHWYTRVPIAACRGRIGWSGSLQTHPRDLDVVGTSVARLIRAGYELHIVGTGQGVHRAFGIPQNHEVGTTGWVDIEAYPMEMADCGIGLVPLQLSAFNQAKSWLKGLEWASLGVPFLASPTDSYLALRRLGIGEVVFKSKRWYDAVKNVDLDLGAEYRQRVLLNGLTIEDRVDEWYNAWVGGSNVR
jgi:O-antigen biosynthesis protein